MARARALGMGSLFMWAPPTLCTTTKTQEEKGHEAPKFSRFQKLFKTIFAQNIAHKKLTESQVR